MKEIVVKLEIVTLGKKAIKKYIKNEKKSLKSLEGLKDNLYIDKK